MTKVRVHRMKPLIKEIGDQIPIEKNLYHQQRLKVPGKFKWRTSNCFKWTFKSHMRGLDCSTSSERDERMRCSPQPNLQAITANFMSFCHFTLKDLRGTWVVVMGRMNHRGPQWENLSHLWLGRASSILLWISATREVRSHHKQC